MSTFSTHFIHPIYKTSCLGGIKHTLTHLNPTTPPINAMLSLPGKIFDQPISISVISVETARTVWKSGSLAPQYSPCSDKLDAPITTVCPPH